MTTRVDPRLAERRRRVAEGNARKRLRRVFWSLVAVAVVGAIRLGGSVALVLSGPHRGLGSERQ